jgi:hypothetical protein
MVPIVNVEFQNNDIETCTSTLPCLAVGHRTNCHYVPHNGLQCYQFGCPEYSTINLCLGLGVSLVLIGSGFLFFGVTWVLLIDTWLKKVTLLYSQSGSLPIMGDS